jgi:hypothetical protein
MTFLGCHKVTACCSNPHTVRTRRKIRRQIKREVIEKEQDTGSHLTQRHDIVRILSFFLRVSFLL